jgi:glutamyl-tRNA reductase
VSRLLVLGLSHRTAPVGVRERYAVASAQLEGLDEKLVRQPQVQEVALVSTCNRTEIVAAAGDLGRARECLLHFLHRDIGDGGATAEQLYERCDAEAVRHVFCVASSLDSMVVGEAQILGQLKAAYRGAVAARSCGPLLNRLFQHAFRTAKRVRSETGLGASSVSVARLGVQLARQIFESFTGKRVMLLGAGEMAEAALVGLRDAGARQLVVLNRTFESARALAERFGGHARELDELEAELGLADVVIASVQVERPILDAPLLQRALAGRQGRPTLIIDLGVPRNVDPPVNDLPSVYLYDLDDIEVEAARGRARRSDALPAAERIVTAEVDAYERWRAALPLVPTIRLLRERVRAQIQAELRRGVTLEEDELQRAVDALAAKILHRPLEQLRREAEEGAASYYADAVRRLFGLGEDGG